MAFERTSGSLPSSLAAIIHKEEIELVDGKLEGSIYIDDPLLFFQRWSSINLYDCRCGALLGSGSPPETGKICPKFTGYTLIVEPEFFAISVINLLPR
jgi:hypothetical protein